MSDNFRSSTKKNELADIVENSIYWIRNNRQLFLSIAGVSLGVILFAAFFLSRYYLVRDRVSDRLSVAESYIYAGQKQQGITLLDEIISQYPTSEAAYKARLHKAESLAAEKKFDEAVLLARETALNGKPEIIRPLAYSHLGTIQENMGDAQGAISTYTEFLEKYPMHFLTPKVLESLGRIYEVSGKISDAQEVYKRISTAYRGSPWDQRASERMYILSNSQQPGKK